MPLLLIGVAPALAQSQAINGSIEGTVKDTSGAALPGVTVTITNTDTGAQRVVVSGGEGTYRAPLLSLGTYDVVAELPGLQEVRAERPHALGRPDRRHQRDPARRQRLGSHHGHRRVADRESRQDRPRPDHRRGGSEEPAARLAKPLQLRVPAGERTGYENNEFGVPRINANGSQMHTNYQLDGNTNTEKDRAGLRLLPVSEVLVREVKLVTNGFAPEFGQTTGMVYNAITPSGTNDFHGSASFRFKRNPFSAKPFFLAPSARKPDTEANDVTATLGGPDPPGQARTSTAPMSTSIAASSPAAR